MSQNHLIDPTWFYDAIEHFAFNYEWFASTGIRTDDHFKQLTTFDRRIIRGSLQTKGVSIELNTFGDRNNMSYEFYCKSLYRINVGDFILYKHRYLHVEKVFDYDEFGVRSAELKMVNLSDYQDFKEYLEYLEGEKIV